MAALTSTERSRLRRARLATTTAAPDLLFVRADWQLYLDPTRLPQKAGCTKWRLRALVLKEIADNSLDHGGKVTVERIDPDTWAIGDDGPGLGAERIVRLFAPNRPLTSSKLLRRPSRGAVGNGLRVVSGAVVASGGLLWVESRGHRYEVKIDRRTGTASVIELSQCNGPGRLGTLVTIRFGAAIPRGDEDDCLALDALRFPGRACEPFRSDVRWYDADAWRELIEATPSGTTASELLAHMGIASNDRRPVTRLKFAELGTLDLPPEPVLLPRGNGGLDGYSYAKESVTHALIEAWAKATERCPPSKGRGDLRVYINRTPPPIRSRIDNEGWAWLGSSEIVCKVEFNGGAVYDLELSVTAPFVPITNDSKAPDLKRWNEAIGRVLAQAMRKAHAALAPTGRKRGDIKEAAYAVMEAAYLKASGDGEYPANARQVMYAGRPMIAEILGPDRAPVDDKRFTQEFLPDFMRENEKLCADWDVVYDARGHLIEPHTGSVTPIGTLDVRGYLRPRFHGPATLLGIAAGSDLDRNAEPTDRYRTVLFIEKEGFEPLLDRARIRERFDCAILSTKGTSVVAARHLLDRLGRDGVRILVAHDFDRAGFCIAHTLTADGRRYQFEHPPETADIGLRLEDVDEMDLQDEPAPDTGPGALLLSEYGATFDEIDFLCERHRRVELNAMTAPQFVEWLERKLDLYGYGKVIPDDGQLRNKARDILAARLIRARTCGIEEQARADAAAAELPPMLAQQVEWQLRDRAELSWEDAVDRIMRQHSPELSGLDDEPDSDND